MTSGSLDAILCKYNQGVASSGLASAVEPTCQAAVPTIARQPAVRTAQGAAARVAAAEAGAGRASPLGERPSAPSSGSGLLQRTISGGGAAVTATQGIWRTISDRLKFGKKPVSLWLPPVLAGS